MQSPFSAVVTPDYYKNLLLYNPSDVLMWFCIICADGNDSAA